MAVDLSPAQTHWRMCSVDQTYWDVRYQSGCWFCEGNQTMVVAHPVLSSPYRGVDLPAPPEFIGGWTTCSG